MYLIKINPNEYLEGTELTFRDLDAAFNFISIGLLNDNNSEFAISVLDNETKCCEE